MKTLLIADDSEGKTAMLLAMLKKADWSGEILIAKTSEEAIRLIDENPEIDFGLIDYYIPSNNGPFIIKELKKKNPNARIALVTSADNPANYKEAESAGAETCICTTSQEDEVEWRIMDLLHDWQE